MRLHHPRLYYAANPHDLVLALCGTITPYGITQPIVTIVTAIGYAVRI